MNKKITVEKIIELLGLEPLDSEGGLYIQSYVSAESIKVENLPERFVVDKPFGTAIYYLLTSDPDSFSALHKLPIDEIYHFYLGDPVELLELNPDGSSEVIILGQEILDGQKVQHVVKRNVWQGSRIIGGGDWALLGTTMAPGYTDEDFVLGNRQELIENYTDKKDLIIDLTR
jgi:predicted cupin superfamily sugar epimerase